MRLLILLGLCYALYRVAKSWLTPSSTQPRTDGREDAARIDDELIKDPVCGSYFPARQAVTLKVDDQTLYFCSQDCRRQYQHGHRPDDH